MTWLWVSAGSPETQAAEGIFADFTTSLGSFSCELHYREAPQTVASFIGLATGERAWLDTVTGEVRSRPFYPGTTFHRVIRGFMIQGGSLNGRGNDGPGYVFPDEFHPTLRHDGPGVLSMANSGPDSNGSQFFITVGAATHLDDRHSVFGRVVSGLDTVTAVSEVATDASDRPLESVTLDSIAVRRVGEAAEAFDIHGHQLPEVSWEPRLIESAQPGRATLGFSGHSYADLYLSHSTDLAQWTSFPLGVDLVAPEQDGVVVATDDEARFFALARVQYPGSTRAPRSLDHSLLTLTFSSGLSGVMAITFTTQGQGTYDHETISGTLLAYSWQQAVYRGYLWPVYFSDNASPPLTLILSFRSETDGTFSGTSDPNGDAQAVDGVFTLARQEP